MTSRHGSGGRSPAGHGSEGYDSAAPGTGRYDSGHHGAGGYDHEPQRNPIPPGAAGAIGRGPEGALGLDTLVRLQRRRSVPDAPRRLAVPDGMTAPLGCDAVAVPDRLGPLVVPRLPRLGCVYTDGARWWWIVPSDSDYALPWPSPAHYAPGALVTGTARLIHRPEGTVPYTPPIPLYLALCRVTGTTPDWL